MCAGHHRIKVEWPRSLTGASKARLGTVSMLRDWLAQSTATLSVVDAALYLVPALQAVLTPPHATLEGLLLGRTDNAAADSLVSLMAGYSVKYDLDARDAGGKPWTADTPRIGHGAPRPKRSEQGVLSQACNKYRRLCWVQGYCRGR